MDDNNHTMPVDTGKTSAYMASLLPSYFITKQFFNGPCSLQIFDHQKYETAPCPTHGVLQHSISVFLVLL